MKLKQRESDVAGTIVAFFSAHGWRPIRHQSGMTANAGGGVMRFGEPGVPDWQMLYYLPDGVALVAWIEMKRPGVREECRCASRRRGLCTSCAQAAWRRAEMLRSDGRAVIVRCHGLTELLWVAGADGKLALAAEFALWYEQRYGWLAEQTKGQMRLTG